MTRRLLTLVVLLLVALPVGAVAYTQVMMRIGSGVAPPMADASQQADLVRVYKGDRRMELWRGDQLLHNYAISLGGVPEGHKQFEGDQRTPEGWYTLDWRNPRSIAHLSLHVSYPNDADRAYAAAQEREPGGQIMIHGILNGWGFLGPLHRLHDWTDGCIAVTNAEMRQIWSLVPNGTPIHIQG